MRGNGEAVEAEVMLEVRRMLGWEPLPPAEASKAEIIPPDPLEDLALTRRLLRKL